MRSWPIRTVVAWAVGILAFFGLKIGVDLVADSLGIVTYLDFGETITVTRGSGPYSYDEEIDGASTAFGTATLIMSAMVAYRIGAAIDTVSLNGGLSLKQRIDFMAWFAGFAILAGVGALLFAVLGGSQTWWINLLHRTLEIGACAMAFLICKAWRDIKLTKLQEAGTLPREP